MPESSAAGSPHIAALTVYPLKSAAGISVPHMPLDDRGAVGDRRWLLVDGEGHAITARECHPLLHVVPRFASDHRDGALLLDAPRLNTLVVAVPGADALERAVTIWGDNVAALDAGDEAAEWCSDAIGRSCRLVRLDDEAQRPLKPKYAGGLPHSTRRVAFSDGAPLLLLSLASVDGLNTRLTAQGQPEPLDRRRFRANVWIGGVDAHAEDQWHHIVMGDVPVSLGSRCLRCVLTTVNPDTLERGAEPLRIFADYRRAEGGVVFGVNATHERVGTVRVGDAITVRALHG